MRIPEGEYGQRLERLRAGMADEGLDALLLTTGLNLAYFSGYPSPARNVARPFFVLLPGKSDPVFFSHTGHALEARRFSWISCVREYTELSRAPVELIAEALAERGIGAGVIGMELGYEQTLDISPLEFRRLESGLAPARLADASRLLWSLRAVKSAYEIDCIRAACRLTADAYAATFAEIRPGMTESAVFAAMHARLEKAEWGNVFLVIASGEGNYDLVTKPPEERPIERGELVWMDAGCTVAGYWSDFSRACVAGKASGEQKRAQEAIQRITAAAVSMIRPGVEASSIARYCLREIESLPFPVTSKTAVLAGRIGHGVGLNMTEPPHLGVYDDTPLRAGMVVTVEPGVATSYGTFHVEENVLVTEDGYAILSDSPRELVEAGA